MLTSLSTGQPNGSVCQPRSPTSLGERVYSGHVRRNLFAELPVLKPLGLRNTLAIVLASMAPLVFQCYTFKNTLPLTFPIFEGNGK